MCLNSFLKTLEEPLFSLAIIYEGLNFDGALKKIWMWSRWHSIANIFKFKLEEISDINSLNLHEI